MSNIETADRPSAIKSGVYRGGIRVEAGGNALETIEVLQTAFLEIGNPMYALTAWLWCINGGNATQAVREAGYQGTDASLRVMASRIMSRPDVQKACNTYMAARGASLEQLHGRLTDLAAVSLDDFYDEDPYGNPTILNLRKARLRGKLWAVKQISFTLTGIPYVEFHDQMRAYDLLIKLHKLLLEKAKMEAGKKDNSYRNYWEQGVKVP